MHRAGQVAQELRDFPGKLDNLSPTPGVYIGEGDNRLCLSSELHTCDMALPPQTQSK